jgi:two-component system sensor histidine kinase UhpB
LAHKKLLNNSFNLQQLKHMRHLKIELINSTGKVIDSNQKKDDNTFQNEAPAWFERLLNQLTTKWEPSVRKLEYQGIILGELVITPDPTYEYAEKWKQITELLTLVLVFFVLVNLMVIWAVSQALKPTTKILDALNELENGNLAARLPAFKLPELSRIGEKFNRMVEKLQLSILQNHKLTQQLITLQEEERKNLARELHDELGQYVTAIKTFAVGIANKTVEKMPDISSNAQTIVAAANHIYDGMHSIIRHLRPGSLDNLGLSETLKDAVNHLQKQHPDIEFELDLAGELDELGENLNINFYRIVQESLNNAIKHAKASIIQVSLKKDKQGNLNLKVQDNGVGMDADKVDQTQHFGLLGMRERTQAFHGIFNIESSPSKGTTISICIPKETIA